MLEGDIGLVTIANFYQGTADRVKQGVDELQQQGAKALIFDVRSNPGGVCQRADTDFGRSAAGGCHLPHHCL